MLERAPKSSHAFDKKAKAACGLVKSFEHEGHMASDREISPAKTRSGLFALVTARLQDAHEITVKGQAAETRDGDVSELIDDLRSIADEMAILIDAIDSLSSR